jgi:hypothetical protein
MATPAQLPQHPAGILIVNGFTQNLVPIDNRGICCNHQGIIPYPGAYCPCFVGSQSLHVFGRRFTFEWGFIYISREHPKVQAGESKQLLSTGRI